MGIRWGMLTLVPLFIIGSLILRHRAATPSMPTSRRCGRRRRRAARRCTSGATAQADLLIVRNLDAGYAGRQVLFGVDIDVKEGEIVALLGTNGAGKSTLLKSISGVVEADRGAVVLDGRDITHAPPDEIAALGHQPDARRSGRVRLAHRGREPAARRAGRAEPTPTAVRRRGARGARALPGAARAASTGRPPTSAVGSSRCSRSAWRSSPSRVCC